MNQHPFPSQSTSYQPHPHPQYSAQSHYDPHRRASISSVASSGVNGTSFVGSSFQASPPVPPYSTPNPNTNAYQAPSSYSPSPGPYQSTPQTVFRNPVAPPRRASTLPSAPINPAQSPAPIHSVVEDPVAAHHRSLVAYYWHYAQQGYSAPLTATPGTEESLMQEKARREAVDWARQCGMEVREVEPTSQPQPQVEGGGRTRTASRPLPVAPSSASPTISNVGGQPPIPPSSSRPASIVGISGGRPLPAPVAPTRSVSLANPPHSTLPNTAPPHRSVSEANPRSLPFPPASSTSQAEPTASDRKRPLPMPPVPRSASLESDQLASRIEAVSISVPAPSPSPAPQPPSIPTISFGDEPPVPPSPRSPSPHPTPPAVPTFAFNDEPEETSASPAVPSFSFSVDDDSAPSNSPTSPDRRAPPVHPRYDPSHPSHTLYHPTSVASPLPDASSRPSTSSLPFSAEAGTIECTSCRQPIFGRVLMALSRTWHPGCFVCAEKGCGEKLEVMEFEGTPDDWEDEDEEGEQESLRGKAWCMVHFEERFALQCYHCHTPISSADYLPINDPSLPPTKSPSSSSTRHATTRYYHPLHFFCAGCGDPFLDPVAYERSGEATAMPYYVREQHPYCEKCDLRIWREKCPGCRLGLREEDGYIEIGGGGGGDEGEKKKWHEGCFKCSMCSKPLTGIYLLRSEPSSSSSTTPSSDGASAPPVEKPYCGECFDIVAKDEASAAVA
ncbi:uncharacterized protein JCM6883_004761 [Sporobolomyces salmoneus]|uniref:uncharacterized protein n=1 Tax=Sporobolomyces salmoneus TaxID=183962 RepID=UPI0031814DA4